MSKIWKLCRKNTPVLLFIQCFYIVAAIGLFVCFVYLFSDKRSWNVQKPKLPLKWQKIAYPLLEPLDPLVLLSSSTCWYSQLWSILLMGDAKLHCNSFKNFLVYWNYFYTLFFVGSTCFFYRFVDGFNALGLLQEMQDIHRSVSHHICWRQITTEIIRPGITFWSKPVRSRHL